MRKNKYNAKRTTIDNITFHSAKEARRYVELSLLQKMDKIADLQLQVPYAFIYQGVKICTYYLDFKYHYIDQKKTIYEDVKGEKTQVYSIKKKMMKAFYQIDITEI